MVIDWRPWSPGSRFYELAPANLPRYLRQGDARDQPVVIDEFGLRKLKMSKLHLTTQPYPGVGREWTGYLVGNDYKLARANSEIRPMQGHAHRSTSDHGNL